MYALTPAIPRTIGAIKLMLADNPAINNAVVLIGIYSPATTGGNLH